MDTDSLSSRDHFFAGSALSSIGNILIDPVPSKSQISCKTMAKLLRKPLRVRRLISSPSDEYFHHQYRRIA